MSEAKPLAHYRPAVRVGDALFCSGHVAADETGRVIDGDVTEQTRLALQNLRRTLQSHGLDLGDVASIGAFLRDMNDFPAFDAEYRKHFPTDPPARTTVGAQLGPGMLVEVNAVAAFGSAR